MTKISQLSSIGDSLAIGDQFLIRDIDDAGSPNKSVTVSGITRALADGDATAPALAFAADKNTGIYRAGTDSLAVATNGSGRLFVDASGNVGVGVASPASLEPGARNLVVGSGSGNNGLSIYSGTADQGIIYFADGTTTTQKYTGFIAYDHNINAMRFGTNDGNERLRITSAGLVGVGTSIPGSFSSAANQLVVGNGSADQGLTVYTGTANQGSIFFADGTTGGAQQAAGYIIYPHSGDYMAFGTANTERLRITSAGLVGIGTSSPSNTASFGQQLQLTGNLPCITIDNTGTGPNKYSLGVNGSAAFGIWDNTASAYRMYINSSGSIGIGSASPSAKLSVVLAGVSGTIIQLSDGIQQSLNIASDAGSGSAGVVSYDTANGAAQAFKISSAERARIDASGRLLVGTSSARGNFFNSTVSAALQVEGTGNDSSSLSIVRNSADTGRAILTLAKTRGGSVGSTTVVQSGDALGSIEFQGSDGTEFVQAAAIQCEVDGTPGANDMPGRLVFSTTSDSASSPTERMRIDSAGNTRFNSASNSATADPGVKIVSSATIPEVRTVVNTSDGGITNYSYYNTNATYNGYRFYVKVDGGVANHSVNNVNLSDRNVKKDISPAADTWDCIKEWEIVNYRYKNQPNTTTLNLGVIAQQVAESCPEVITVFEEAKDDQPEKLGVKEQQMYWMAIKALQEAQARIEALEADVAQLKGA